MVEVIRYVLPYWSECRSFTTETLFDIHVFFSLSHPLAVHEHMLNTTKWTQKHSWPSSNYSRFFSQYGSCVMWLLLPSPSMTSSRDWEASDGCETGRAGNLARRSGLHPQWHHRSRPQGWGNLFCLKLWCGSIESFLPVFTIRGKH